MPDKILLLASSPPRVKAKEGLVEILYGGDCIGSIIVTDSGLQVRFSASLDDAIIKEALEIDERSITIDLKSLLKLSTN